MITITFIILSLSFKKDFVKATCEDPNTLKKYQFYFCKQNYHIGDSVSVNFTDSTELNLDCIKN